MGGGLIYVLKFRDTTPGLGNYDLLAFTYNGWVTPDCDGFGTVLSVLGRYERVMFYVCVLTLGS